MKHYVEFNPALKEQRSPKDVLETLTFSEKKAFHTMTDDEISYVRDECEIYNYIRYLRRGANKKAMGSDFPILVIQGTPLQLERYKVVFLISMIDYQGIKDYYPNDFALGLEALEEIKNFTGLALIRVRRGSATSEGLDTHRSELIASALMNRRDYFNPTLVLAEEVIAGKLNISDGVNIKVIKLDPTRLRGSYEGEDVQVFSSVNVSRQTAPAKPVQTTYVQPAQQKPSYNDNNYGRTFTNRGSNSKGRLTVTDLRRMKEMEEQED